MQLSDRWTKRWFSLSARIGTLHIFICEADVGEPHMSLPLTADTSH